LIKAHGIRWAFERLGLEYMYQRFGMRNRVERFFRYLKERTAVFHHKLSAIPKPTHDILSGREDGEVRENAYPDTI
jgi:transposase-like protein